MRNKYPGTCYRCKNRVEKGEGHFEKSSGGWRTIHAECVFEQRREKELAQKLENPSEEGLRIKI